MFVAIQLSFQFLQFCPTCLSSRLADRLLSRFAITIFPSQPSYKSKDALYVLEIHPSFCSVRCAWNLSAIVFLQLLLASFLCMYGWIDKKGLIGKSRC
jgi:hypothetical protein